VLVVIVLAVVYFCLLYWGCRDGGPHETATHRA
jgi:hypothetical protein